MAEQVALEQVTDNAPQLTVTNGPVRPDSEWIARAAISFRCPIHTRYRQRLSCDAPQQLELLVEHWTQR